MLVGRLVDRSENHVNVKIEDVLVKGTFGTESLTEATFAAKSFGGNSSDYKAATGLSYGEYVAPQQ